MKQNNGEAKESFIFKLKDSILMIVSSLTPIQNSLYVRLHVSATRGRHNQPKYPFLFFFRDKM